MVSKSTTIEGLPAAPPHAQDVVSVSESAQTAQEGIAVHLLGLVFFAEVEAVPTSEIAPIRDLHDGRPMLHADRFSYTAPLLLD
jgi:hypothetical protein